MRGQIIVVKDVTAKALKVRLWDFNDIGVFIHSEEEFHKRMTGQEYLNPVVFPIEDAFEYDILAEKELSATDVDWSKLKPLKCPVMAP